jgi:hypothetical protein
MNLVDFALNMVMVEKSGNLWERIKNGNLWD